MAQHLFMIALASQVATACLEPSLGRVGADSDSVGAADGAPEPNDAVDATVVDLVPLPDAPTDRGAAAELPTEEVTAPPTGPVAILKIEEGFEVIPQTALHLVGSDSYAPAGIVSYEWNVQQPQGSVSVFYPTALHPDPVIEVNVAGLWLFTLTVCDTQGVCDQASESVLVVPNETIHIELLWHTPGDPDEADEGDEAGADLDLHFMHMFALLTSGFDMDGDGEPDGWMSSPYDCFWFNPHPYWADPDPTVDDDPGLDRDDTDGAGPENINLDLPEAGITYTVGVHYWDDHDFGASDAVVRIYLDSVLAAEYTCPALVRHDLWAVATIDWPSGLVTPLAAPGEDCAVIHDFKHPLFVND